MEILIDCFKFKIDNITKSWDACIYVNDFDLIEIWEKTKEQKWELLSGVDAHDVESFYSDILKSRIEKEMRKR